MKNRDFIGLLRTEKFTIEMLADGIFSSRSHVNQVLRNNEVEGRPNFGCHTRRKLIKFFKTRFTVWPAMLAALKWTEKGAIIRQECHTCDVPRGT